jgi:hypothetical protein
MIQTLTDRASLWQNLVLPVVLQRKQTDIMKAAITANTPRLVAIILLLFLGQSKTYAFNTTTSFSTSFDLVRGIILVKAELDGEVSNFILDTGSPMMILNEKPTSEGTKPQANTIGGGLAGEWKTIGQFSWAGVHKFNMDALSMDISHLEYLTDKPIKGLIGYEFFGDFDLMLDFENQVVTLVPPNHVREVEKWTLKSELEFELEGHIPVINAYIGDTLFRLGLDTGAGTNLLDSNRKPAINEELITPVKNAAVVGLANGATRIDAADIVETTIADNHYWGMRYVFTDISNMKNLKDNQVDGLLGYPFFKSGKFTINYNERRLGIWE